MHTYQEAAGKLTALFTRIKDFQRRAQEALSDPPAGCDVLKGIDGVQVLDAVVLSDRAQGHRRACRSSTPWSCRISPIPSGLVAAAVEFCRHVRTKHDRAAAPGPRLVRSRVSRMPRAELEATQERKAAYHVQAAKAEEDRINKELKERFLARRRA